MNWFTNKKRIQGGWIMQLTLCVSRIIFYLSNKSSKGSRWAILRTTKPHRSPPVLSPLFSTNTETSYNIFVQDSLPHPIRKACEECSGDCFIEAIIFHCRSFIDCLAYRVSRSKDAIQEHTMAMKMLCNSRCTSMQFKSLSRWSRY